MKCKQCNEVKTLDDFYITGKSKKTGENTYRHTCKECTKAHVQKWKSANVEAQKKYYNKWLKNNREQWNEYSREYRKRNQLFEKN